MSCSCSLTVVKARWRERNPEENPSPQHMAIRSIFRPSLSIPIIVQQNIQMGMDRVMAKRKKHGIIIGVDFMEVEYGKHGNWKKLEHKR